MSASFESQYLLDGQRALYRDNGTQWYPLNRGVIDVRDFGAYCDAKYNTKCQCTLNSKIITRSGTDGYDFTAEDVGKTLIGYNHFVAGHNFVGVIESYQSATQVTLVANAPFTLGGMSIMYGHDDTVAIQNAIEATKKVHPLSISRGLFTGKVFLPNASIITNTLLFKDKSIHFYGNGWGALMHDSADPQLGQFNAPNPQPGSALIWGGAAGLPMIYLQDCLDTRLSDFRLQGNTTTKPIGIRCEFAAGSGHINAYGTIERVWIGSMFVSAEPNNASATDRTFSVGIQGYTLLGNTDFYKLNTILMRGCDIGFDSNNANITYWDWQTVLMHECGIGFKVVGDVHGRCWFFANNDLDIQIGDSGVGVPEQAFHGRLVLDHFGSEGSKKMLNWKGAGSVIIRKGSWQAFPNRANADGLVITACTSAFVGLDISDFEFTTAPDIAPDYLHKIKVGEEGGLRVWRLRVVNCKGITPESFVVPSGAANDGRAQGIIEYDMKPVSFPGVTSKSYIHYDPEESEKPHNRHDFNGRVNVRGGSMRVKKLRTTGLFYNFPTGITALGGGSGTNYEYLVSALSGEGEALGTNVLTVANGALGGAIKNRIYWYMIVGATAFKIYGRAVGQRKRLVTLDAWKVSIDKDSGAFYWDDDNSVVASADDVPTQDSTGRVVAEGAIVTERVLIEGVNTVTFSSTPVFNAALGNTQKITLTGNVTSSTLINPPAAGLSQQLTFLIAQDATGGRTFAYPANVKGGMVVGSTANTVSVQTFRYDGTNWRAETPGVVS